MIGIFVFLMSYIQEPIHMTISSAYSYLTHISGVKMLNFCLPHFIRLCNLLEKHKNIINKSMKTTVVNNDQIIHIKLQMVFHVLKEEFVY